ncbi:unknown [Akkermansia sp. CAG:344]|nr:unknown [Akkermansia sp. CAG:344]
MGHGQRLLGGRIATGAEGHQFIIPHDGVARAAFQRRDGGFDIVQDKRFAVGERAGAFRCQKGSGRSDGEAVVIELPEGHLVAQARGVPQRDGHQLVQEGGVCLVFQAQQGKIGFRVKGGHGHGNRLGAVRGGHFHEAGGINDVGRRQNIAVPQVNAEALAVRRVFLAPRLDHGIALVGGVNAYHGVGGRRELRRSGRFLHLFRRCFRLLPGLGFGSGSSGFARLAAAEQNQGTEGEKGKNFHGG